MRQFRIVASFALAAALGACGGSGGSSLSTSPGGNQNPGGGTQPGASTVTLANLAFSPPSITVTAGSAVNWKWNDCTGGDGYGGGGATCIAHQIAFDDGSGITSASQDQGTFTRTFGTKGTYKYHCTIHGAAMSGEVVVQ